MINARKNNGNQSWPAKLTIGKSPDRSFIGVYPVASWIACPTSWAATLTAAMEFWPKLPSDSLTVLVRGS
jgi:hypothetical protein